MIRVMIGVFIVLHGLVHMLYFGQSTRHFELQPGMVWPDGSWAFSGVLGEGATRTLASILLVVAAIALAIGGIGILASQPWSRAMLGGAAVYSSVIFILFWDGAAQRLDNQGIIGILINVAILAALLPLWPRFES